MQEDPADADISLVAVRNKPIVFSPTRSEGVLEAEKSGGLRIWWSKGFIPKTLEILHLQSCKLTLLTAAIGLCSGTSHIKLNPIGPI